MEAYIIQAGWPSLTSTMPYGGAGASATEEQMGGFLAGQKQGSTVRLLDEDPQVQNCRGNHWRRWNYC